MGHLRSDGQPDMRFKANRNLGGAIGGAIDYGLIQSVFGKQNDKARLQREIREKFLNELFNEKNWINHPTTEIESQLVHMIKNANQWCKYNKGRLNFKNYQEFQWLHNPTPEIITTDFDHHLDEDSLEKFIKKIELRISDSIYFNSRNVLFEDFLIKFLDNELGLPKNADELIQEKYHRNIDLLNNFFVIAQKVENEIIEREQRWENEREKERLEKINTWIAQYGYCTSNSFKEYDYGLQKSYPFTLTEFKKAKRKGIEKLEETNNFLGRLGPNPDESWLTYLDYYHIVPLKFLTKSELKYMSENLIKTHCDIPENISYELERRKKLPLLKKIWESLLRL